MVDLANLVMNLSEVDSMRYCMYAIYLCGDPILATKTAFVAFIGQFLLVMMKLTYKEPRPYWIITEIMSYRCQNDFEGPSDHIFLIMFVGTYLNLIYLRKYARTPKRSLSAFLFFL